MNKKFSITTIILALLITVMAVNPFISLGEANPNPFGHPQIISQEGTPDSKTNPPTVSITSPLNRTSYSLSNLSLNFNVSIGDSSTASVRFIWAITYKADWLPSNITIYEFNANKDPYIAKPTITNFLSTLNLTGIPEGTHTVVIHAKERGAYEKHDSISGFITKTYITNFFIEGSSSITFTVDRTPPNISILSIENNAHYTSDVPLTVVTDELISQITYSIDGLGNVTAKGNTTLSGLTVGVHNVTVFAWDFAGNVGMSETVSFTVAKPEPALSFSTPVVAASSASVIVAMAGLFVFLRKRRKQEHPRE